MAREGDTLCAVADAFGISAQSLAAFNGITACDPIYPGQILHLKSFGAPEGGGFYGAYVVARGDTLTGIARRFGTTAQALFEANAIRDRNLIVTGQILVIPWPNQS